VLAGAKKRRPVVRIFAAEKPFAELRKYFSNLIAGIKSINKINVKIKMYTIFIDFLICLCYNLHVKELHPILWLVVKGGASPAVKVMRCALI